jgi:hypothetical protein
MRPLVSAVSTVTGLQPSPLLEISQCGLTRVHSDVDASTATAVSAVWTAARHVRLTAHGRRAVASAPGREVQVDDVEKHRYGRKRAGL